MNQVNAETTKSRLRCSKRQEEILSLAARGLPDKLIGELLGVSVWTVREHWCRMYHANAVRNRTAAVALWLKANADPANS